MRTGFTPEQEAFRREVAEWLDDQLSGPFASIRNLASMSAMMPERREWERALGKGGWSAIGWPEEHGGRGASIAEQVIFAEEYARAGAPGRIGHIGVTLAGPTLIHFGTEEQKRRFLPAILSGEELWAQGYSEPNAGSDLANIRTKARLEDGPNGLEWVIEGQKIWTSLAQYAEWIFVLCRTEEGSQGPKGLSFLLVPLDQPGVTLRPIRQMTGDAEFNETFFDGARTAAANVVGQPGEGWKVAMGLLSHERGASSLAIQMTFRNELQKIIAAANANGAARDPLIRQRIATAHAGLKLMRFNALRTLSKGDNEMLSRESFIHKIYWGTWHKKLGELAMDVVGAPGLIAEGDAYAFGELPQIYLYTRSETIHGGTNQIQRNIIAERGLGLPREPRG
ncbi:acyl-CoA dehydrogenase [Croceicoccus estronivorus]|uniref:acyl-CoA dehydrogenase family protein n=1 Tax=Croceicoccus estronivorus TaxID=1172626 RepID=UPI00082CC741|nr:acyl-CoA dehydrogenase family protein [Croceicoccus estronivorus]OCC22491.1 acyl-CoA dehydrogenase [Croceicoccus estronivorus]